MEFVDTGDVGKDGPSEGYASANVLVCAFSELGTLISTLGTCARSLLSDTSASENHAEATCSPMEYFYAFIFTVMFLLISSERCPGSSCELPGWFLTCSSLCRSMVP